MNATKIVAVAAAIALLVAPAAASPLPGQVLKFQQLPMEEIDVAGQLYYGHDELSTLYNLGEFAGGDPLQFPQLYRGEYVADDFADPFSRPVLHVRWWGSRLDNEGFPIDKFLISFEDDVAAEDPGNEYGFSHPGEPLLNQVVVRGPLSPGSGTFEEMPIHPGGPPLDEELIEYNAELTVPFDQEPDKVYWLKIAALVDMEDFNGDGAINVIDIALAPRWGWHNRDYTIPDPLASVPPAVNPGEGVIGELPDATPVWHFQDDAVAGEMEAIWHDPFDASFVEVNQLLSPFPPQIPDFTPQLYLPDIDGPSEVGMFSKDLAFELYTIPEPATLLLALVAALAWRRNM